MIGGGALFLGVEGVRLTAAERRTLARVAPAGVVLFARNVGTESELAALVADLRTHVPGGVLAVDAEGGRVDRLRSLAGAAPAAAALARARPAQARRAGRWVGAALARLDLDLDLAPVVDLDRGWRGNALDGRCLGAGPRAVTARAAAFLAGLHDSGVGGCVKHFPGLGGAELDTHEAPARVALTAAELERDLEPFRRLAAAAECALVGHAIYPALDPSQRPASLSSAIAGGPLRSACGLGRSAMLSDDLEMGALAPWGALVERGEQALAAGCDGLLFCRRLDQAEAIARRLARPALRRRLAEAIARLERLRRWLARRRQGRRPAPPLPRIASRLARLAAALESA